VVIGRDEQPRQVLVILAATHAHQALTGFIADQLQSMFTIPHDNAAAI
jgi:hypothetical protein